MIDPPKREMLIGGHSTASHDRSWLAVFEPATGDTLALVPRAGVEDVDRAVAAAARALPGWRHTSPVERGRALAAVADRLEARTEEIARLLCRESGNAIRRQSRPEVHSAVALLRYFAGVAGELKGETVPLGPGIFNYTIREPVGVVGAMTPWNAPLQLAAVKIAMSLVTGNTLVLKVSEEAPLAVLELADLSRGVLPDGVLNVLSGFGPEVGAALVSHPGIAKLSFTGSTSVGTLIMRAAADRTVPVSLELGGKSPALVFPDADDDVSVQGVLDGMRFPRQGQSCTAGTRLLVHDSIFEGFVDRVADAADQLVIGDPLEEATDIGTIINRTQFERVRTYVEGAITAGAKRRTTRIPRSGVGHFMTPTVLTGVEPHWPIAQEEVFGPVMVAMPWSGEQEAVRLANDSSYGLAAYVWTHDIGTALRMSDQLEAGWVQINRGLGQLPGMSYGGIKRSGIGREFSIEGALESFTHRKTVTVGVLR